MERRRFGAWNGVTASLDVLRRELFSSPGDMILWRVYLRREIRRLSGPIPLLGRHIGRLDPPNFLGYGFCEPTAGKRGLGDTAIPIALCTAELLERPGHV